VTASKLGTHKAYGTFSPSATGNKAITGVGFQPKYVRLEILSDRGTTASTTDTIEGFGIMTSSLQVCKCTHTTGTNSYMYSSTSACLAGLHFNSTTPELLATFVSMDSDGFTINFSAFVSTYLILWIAEA